MPHKPRTLPHKTFKWEEYPETSPPVKTRRDEMVEDAGLELRGDQQRTEELRERIEG